MGSMVEMEGATKMEGAGRQTIHSDAPCDAEDEDFIARNSETTEFQS